MRKTSSCAVVLAIVGTASGCASPGRSDSSIDDGGAAPDRVERDAIVGTGPDAGASHAEAAATEGGEAGASLITVAGSLADDLDDIIPDRAINLIDAAGVSQVVITDMMGHFTIAGVAVPYSLSVAAPPGGSAIVYVGLTTAKPLLWGDTSAAASPEWNTAKIAFDVTLPACGAECSVYFGGFANGKAAYAYDVESYTPLTVAPANIEVGWSGPSTASAGVDVLIANASLSSFWHTQVTATVSNGDTVNAGSFLPTSIPTATTLNVTSTEEGVPSGWPTPSLSIGLTFAAGGVTTLTTVPTSLLSAGIPDLPGATLSVSAWTSLVEDGGVEPRAYASAGQGSLPLTSPAATTTVYAPASWVTPSTAGSTAALSLGSSKLAWVPYTGAPTGFDVLYISSTSPSAFVCYVFSADTSVSLPDLVKLGVPLAPGPFVIEMAEMRPEPALDAVVEKGNAASIIDTAPVGISDIASSEVSVTFSP
jgi:hypothetical protein